MLTNVLENHEKLKRCTHTKVIHPLSSPQFPSYHERSSDRFKTLPWNNSQDARFTYKKYNDDRFENISGRSSLILLSHKRLQEINAILYEWQRMANTTHHTTNIRPNVKKPCLYFTLKGKPDFTHVRFESHFPFILYRIEHKYGFN